MTALSKPGISSAEANILTQAIGSLNSGNFLKVVTNANLAESQAEVLTGVTQKLQNQGIQFLSVF
jgi:hypothetical protein